MNIQPELLKEVAEAQSMAILREESSGFEFSPVIGHPQGVSSGFLIEATNVCIIPGQEKPPLHRFTIRNPLLGDDLAERAVSYIEDSALFREMGVFLRPSDFESLAGNLVTACEGIQEDLNALTIPPVMATLGMFVIFSAEDGIPFAGNYYSGKFAEVLVKNMPYNTDSDRIMTEHGKMLARISEHAESTESHEEWKEAGRIFLDRFFHDDPDLSKIKSALGLIQYLLLPERHLPTSFKRLFS